MATVYRQFHRPTGLSGRVAGWIMANRPSNVQRNRWTVDLLNLEPSDHVLEIGFGPGLAIQQVARLVPRGHVVGVDHSPLMVKHAGHRNQSAVEAGLVDLKLGGFELLPQLGETFDKVFSVNVLQFLRERTEVLRLIRSVLKPNGLVATTVQPRHRGATAADAHAFGSQLSQELIEVGFREVAVKELDLKPVPAVCVLARNGLIRRFDIRK
jgi:ubiquinone/menaquinone biosynthesis C-methylase UbiE